MKYWGFNSTVVVTFPLLQFSPHAVRIRACAISVMTTTVPLAQCAQLNRP